MQERKKSKDSPLRFWLGCVALFILTGVAIGLYISNRDRMNNIDWLAMYVSIGFIGGLLFYMVDPVQTQSFRWRKTINIGGAAAIGASFMLLANYLTPSIINVQEQADHYRIEIHYKDYLEEWLSAMGDTAKLCVRTEALETASQNCKDTLLLYHLHQRGVNRACRINGR